jgi:hypothetical protein
MGSTEVLLFPPCDYHIQLNRNIIWFIDPFWNRILLGIKKNKWNEISKIEINGILLEN